LEYMPEDPILKDKRYGASLQHAQTFRPGFTGNVDYNRVSDDRYFVDLASQVRQVSLGNLQQDAYVTYTGSLAGSGYTMQARVQRFQTLQDPLAPGQEAGPHATIPWFSADSGLIFERDSRWFGENLTQTLEPRLFYVRVPFRNQDQMPLFDTALADFNYAQLFSENRFAGGDRFGDANQATLALTTRFLQSGGQEAFRATVGQRYYFEEERVGLTPTSELRNYHTSDVLASVGGRLFRYWSFDATTQYNPRDQRSQRYTVATRYAPELAKVVNFSYRFNRDPATPLKQVDVSGQWPVAAGWYAVGRYNYSILDKRLLEGLAGFEYNAGCWVFR